MNPFVELSYVGKSFKDKQASMKEFFHCNPTPACGEINNDDEEVEEVHIPVHSASKNQVLPAAPVPMNPPVEFYSQLIETMKKHAGSPATSKNCRQIQGSQGVRQPCQVAERNAAADVCERRN